ALGAAPPAERGRAGGGGAGRPRRWHLGARGAPASRSAARAPRLARPCRSMARLDPRAPPALRQARARRRPDRNRRLLVRRHRLSCHLPSRLRGPLPLGRTAADRLRDRLCTDAADTAAGRGGRGRGALAVRADMDGNAARGCGHRRYRLQNRQLLAADRACGLRPALAAGRRIWLAAATAVPRSVVEVAPSIMTGTRSPAAAAPVKLTVVLRRVRPRSMASSVRLGPSTGTSSARPMRVLFRASAPRWPVPI